MIDVNALLDDKETWKICEAVHLGLDSIFLKFNKKSNAKMHFIKGLSEGLFRNYERFGRSRNIYKFYLTDSTILDYRENIMPQLQDRWWTKKKHG